MVLHAVFVMSFKELEEFQKQHQEEIKAKESALELSLKEEEKKSQMCSMWKDDDGGVTEETYAEST